MLKPISYYQKLHKTKIRQQEGFFLVEGINAICQVFNISPKSIQEILIVKEEPELKKVKSPQRLITYPQLKRISLMENPCGPIAIVKLPKDTYSKSFPQYMGEKILVLEDIQDPGNVGTLIRSAAAFGFDGVLLSEKCADPFSFKVVQASAGAILSLWMRKTYNFYENINKLLNEGYFCIAADLKGHEDININTKQKIILAIGNEKKGLTQNILTIANDRIKIPINQNRVQSLNAAVAGSILMSIITLKQL